MRVIVFSLIALLVALLAYRIWRYGWPDDEAARETVAEFARRFPGRCMICSMHRYGYTHGHERNALPEPHPCIEERHANRGKLR